MNKAKNLTILFITAFLFGTGCTLNFVVDIESASGRDGTISESASEEATTTPTIDVTADANGL